MTDEKHEEEVFHDRTDLTLLHDSVERMRAEIGKADGAVTEDGTLVATGKLKYRESIADGIHRVLTDDALRSGLREKGLARAREFSWATSVRRIREIYGEAADMPFREADALVAGPRPGVSQP